MLCNKTTDLGEGLSPTAMDQQSQRYTPSNIVEGLSPSLCIACDNTSVAVLSQLNHVTSNCARMDNRYLCSSSVQHTQQCSSAASVSADGGLSLPSSLTGNVNACASFGTNFDLLLTGESDVGLSLAQCNPESLNNNMCFIPSHVDSVEQGLSPCSNTDVTCTSLSQLCSVGASLSSTLQASESIGFGNVTSPVHAVSKVVEGLSPCDTADIDMISDTDSCMQTPSGSCLDNGMLDDTNSCNNASSGSCRLSGQSGIFGAGLSLVPLDPKMTVCKTVTAHLQACSFVERGLPRCSSATSLNVGAGLSLVPHTLQVGTTNSIGESTGNGISPLPLLQQSMLASNSAIQCFGAQ